MTPSGIARLKLDEGFRSIAYNDKTGKPPVFVKGGNITIGYGRNLTGKGISEAEAELMLTNDLDGVWAAVSKGQPWLYSLSISKPVWADVIEMVHYNTGDVFKFPNMLASMSAGNAEGAAAALMDSKAAKELPERYSRMRDAIIAGHW